MLSNYEATSCDIVWMDASAVINLSNNSRSNCLVNNIGTRKWRQLVPGCEAAQELPQVGSKNTFCKWKTGASTWPAH
ncbi:unnamed protein product [Gongylonema pulchrum]|uniref:SRCR domain-containing protein n=1 Tax=Gongylonema pulchrum TaxID=637853 RepID=A0A183DS66_9BILA|nr:unnamed protein product [Gongylonema pulchrum]